MTTKKTNRFSEEDIIINDIFEKLKLRNYNWKFLNCPRVINEHNEESVLRKIISSSLEGKQVDFSREKYKTISGDCLQTLLSSKILESFPNGIRVKCLIIIGVLNLNYSKIDFPVIFEHCNFSGVNLMDAKTRYLSFKNSSFKNINASRVSVDSSLCLGRITSCEGVELNDAFVKGNIFLHGAKIGSIKDEKNIYCGKAIVLDRISIGGSLCLYRNDRGNEFFRSKGEFSIIGGKIGGNFTCRKAEFNINNPTENYLQFALIANLTEIKGDFSLRDVKSHGQMLLMNMNISGELKFTGGLFTHQNNINKKQLDQYHHAVSLDRSAIKGTVFLNKAEIHGQFRLIGTSIMSDLECIETKFLVPEPNIQDNKSTLLIARGNICGDIKLENSLTSGFIGISSVKVGSHIYITECNFEKSDNKEKIKIEDCSVFCSIIWRNNKFSEVKNTIIKFDGSRCADFHHDFNNSTKLKSVLKISMDGFVYNKLNDKYKSASSIEWAKLIDANHTTEACQNLATVLAKEGKQEQAENVLIMSENKKYKFYYLAKKGELEKEINFENSKDRIFFNKMISSLFNRREEDSYTKHLYRTIRMFHISMQYLFVALWSKVFCITTGYGYRPWRSLFVAISFIILGTFIFRFSEPVPTKLSSLTDQEKQEYIQNTNHHLPSWYPNFSPCVFSIETFLPVGNLGVKDYWTINKETLTYKYKYIHQIVGWIISLLAAAGVTAKFIRHKP